MPRGVKNQPAPRVYVCTMSFSSSELGSAIAGLTRVREGHPMLKRWPQMFAPIDGEAPPEVEAATAAPGETRGGDTPEPVAESEPEPEPEPAAKTSGITTASVKGTAKP